MTTDIDITQPVTPDAILQTGFAWWGSKTLLSAVELGVFSALAASGPLSEHELHGELGLHPRGARDFLDALVALGFLEREDGRYRNVPASDAFLDHAKPGYVGDFLAMAGSRPTWHGLTDALRTGEPQHEGGVGDDFFDAVYSDPDKLQDFLRAMTANSAGSARALTAAFPWERYSSVVDVGCAEGAVPVALAHAHDHLNCAGFDLPVVGTFFEQFVDRAGLHGRVRFHAGDFLSDALPAADVLVMGHVLHDWSLETKQLLLAKAHDALPPGGALIVYETLIDDDRRENTFSLLMSLNMLVESRGGFDFTGADCERWMRDAGFTETRVQHLVGPVSMAIAVK
ncbi:MAG: acetylserotonin O-methyltransferase [Actinobacteria bacterium]|nr:acetylserotonin O-methyltransferase [Actinomycetota bacterium]